MARKIRPPRLTNEAASIETKLGRGGRILVDPDLLPGSGALELSVLPILFDKVLLSNPDHTRILSWGLDQSHLSALAEQKIVTPIAAGETHLDNFPPNSQVTRTELLPDEEFYALYQRAVAADMEDPDFDSIVHETGRAIGHDVPKDVAAFDANWDFLLSLRLRAPVASSSASRRLWAYKLSSLETFREPGAPSSHQDSARDLSDFIVKYTLRLPSSLTIDELRAIRDDEVARKFRAWFHGALSRARTRSSVTAIGVDELLLREFRELLESHLSRIELGAGIVTASIMTGVGLIIGPAEGIVSVVTYPLFKRLVARAAARWGSQRWIEVITGLAPQALAG
jgi:hypothetical protein